MNHSPSILPGNAVVGQSGGPTAVINQSMVGVVETLCHQEGIEKILGSIHGVRGIINDQFVDLKEIPQKRLERIAETPSAALGSSRDKPDEKYCEQIFQHFENITFGISSTSVVTTVLIPVESSTIYPSKLVTNCAAFMYPRRSTTI